jgi:hypothetical protein
MATKGVSGDARSGQTSRQPSRPSAASGLRNWLLPLVARSIRARNADRLSPNAASEDQNGEDL